MYYAGGNTLCKMIDGWFRRRWGWLKDQSHLIMEKYRGQKVNGKVDLQYQRNEWPDDQV